MKLIKFLILLLNVIYSIKCQRGDEESRLRQAGMQKCYVFDNSQITNRAVKCIPDFINAAYNKKFQVTNTCGSPPIEYCVHNNIHSYGDKHKTIGNRKCYVCDANDSQNSHGVEYLTDYDKNTKSPTWWQSETMEQGIDYPNSVNLTLNLGKSFEITYIRITFQSLVPESFVIYKRRHDDGEWIPYQFFSSSCEKTYDRQSQDTLTRGDDVDKAICTAEFTDIIPLSGGMIAFSTLEGRPNGQFVDIQKNLQDWVIATDIRITLNRLNSFGDQFISGDQAKNAYFYAISDIAIGGRCHCNGHAGRCKTDDNINYYCECWHNTDGVDCEKCRAGFNDVEWRPAIYGEHLGFECKQCNCNGYSNECFYDHDLFLKTGHGGHCTNCFGNRSGPNCEQCNFGYYRTETNEACIDCGCNQIGSESLQCDPTGKCKCKPGVDGQKCDRCAQNYFDLSINGCQQCSCNPTGSAHSPPICNSIDGTCQCKSNVEGKNCDKCKPGFFSLQESNIYGCFQCFCYGHSSECTSSTNYKISFIKSNDMKIIDSNWKLSNPNLKIVYDHEKNEYRVKNDNNLSINEVIYLLLPNEYLGNKRLSFNSELEIELKLENSLDSFRNMRIKDLVIENSNENLDIHGQIVPSNSFQKFTFRLNHLANWHQRLSQERFQRLISNITSIKIRMNYNYNIEDTVIKSIILQDATLIDNFNTNDDQIATHIEQCKCPEGYTGQFCDQCKSGYKRENPSLGLFSRCIPCTCNNHSDTCDQFTGKCNCMHHTTGDNCEQCESGFYGQALTGTANDCQKCPCPNNGPCSEIYNYHDEKNNVVCVNCPVGTQGNLCESCEDGYFSKSIAECIPCSCNDNIDLNAIGNCDRTNGNCLRCVYNTTGNQCEKCLPGYWGNALTDLKCHACECFGAATIENENLNENLDDIQCDLNNGQCNCKPNVMGRQCNECENGFWNITSGNGCIDCKCDMLGAKNKFCDKESGQCACKLGVTGLKCDQCLPSYYALSDSGCKLCMCDPVGSFSSNCDQLGNCKCKKNVSGMKCNKCDENKYDFKNGCLDCDDCYNLVQRKTKIISNKIEAIEVALSALNNTNSVENTNIVKQLVAKLEKLNELVNLLMKDTYEKENLKETYNQTIKYFDEEIKNIGEILLAQVNNILNKFKDKFKMTQEIYELATLKIKDAETGLKSIRDQYNSGYDKLLQLQSDDFFTNSHHKNETITTLAKDARNRYEFKESIIKNLEDMINKALEETKKSYENLQNLDMRIKKGMLLSEKVDAANLKERIENLISEGETSKDSIESRIIEVTDLVNSLQKFSLSPDYKKSIEEFEKYIDTFKQQQIALKKEIESTSSQLDMYIEKDSKSAITKANLKFSDANRKWMDMNNYNATISIEKVKCESRVKKLIEMFANATNILETLKNFDEKISFSKQEAQKAELLKPDTLENIDKSRALVKNIRENIQTQSFNEFNPVDINTDKFDRVKSTADAFLEKSKISETFLNKLNDKVNSLPNKDKISSLSQSLVEKHDEFSKKVKNITENAKTVLQDVSNAIDQTIQINKKIEEYSIENISIKVIEELKNKYQTISDEIDLQFSSDAMDKIIKSNEEVNKKIKTTEASVIILENQVKELEKLNQTLVRRCFKNTQSAIESRK